MRAGAPGCARTKHLAGSGSCFTAFSQPFQWRRGFSAFRLTLKGREAGRSWAGLGCSSFFCPGRGEGCLDCFLQKPYCCMPKARILTSRTPQLHSWTCSLDSQLFLYTKSVHSGIEDLMPTWRSFTGSHLLKKVVRFAVADRGGCRNFDWAG